MTIATPSGPWSGQDIAVAAWALTRADLERVLPPSPPESVLAEVRAQLAAWASARPTSLYADVESAWNSFIAPRPGFAGPAVLLPRAACGVCSDRKRLNEEMQRRFYADCGYCRGQGYLPPRAIPAKYATSSAFLSALPGHVGDAAGDTSLAGSDYSLGQQALQPVD